MMFYRIRLFRLLLSLVLISTLWSCGGAPSENRNYLLNNGAGIRVWIESQGINSGTLTVTVGQSSVQFAGDSTQSVLELPNDEGFVTARISSAPSGQECFFSPSNLTEVNISADGLAVVACSTPGITGTVKNFFTGDALSGLTLNVVEVTSGGNSQFASVTTAADGSYSITDTVPGNRYSISVDADGFAPQTVISIPQVRRSSQIANMVLVPEIASVNVDPTGSMVFSAEGVTVLEVPADGLVTSANAAPVGEVTGRITFLDASTGAEMLPGRYEALSGASASPIESFGALAVELVDANGDELQLMDGVTAQVTIPVANRLIGSTPADASLYLFDHDSGYWNTSFNASLGIQGTTNVYEASVTSLSKVFTIGQVYQSVNVTGCIEDAAGNAILSATIVAQGGSYIGLSFAVSDDSGLFSVPAKASSNIFVYGLVGARSRTASVNTGDSGTEVAPCLLFDTASTVITLEWGDVPSDLDSHLYGPTGEGRFHIDWTNKSQVIGTQTLFLDVDDVTSFGPEVTTIPRYPFEGLYEFLVHNYSGNDDQGGTISESPARVNLNVQGEEFPFTPPAGTPTECWHVFNIEVDSALRGTVVTVNEWVSESTCTGSTTKRSLMKQRSSQSPMHRAIQGKYYAQ